MENRRKEKKTLLLWYGFWRVIATAALAGTAWLGKPAAVGACLGRGYPVYISEVMTYNTVCPNEDGVLCDWVELRNSSDSRFDLSGYRLSDEEGRPKYVFPAGTELAPGECIVVWCDPELEGEEYASFALNRDGGETVYFMNASNVTLDAAVTVACEKNESLIRGEDGSLNPWGVPDARIPQHRGGGGPVARGAGPGARGRAGAERDYGLQHPVRQPGGVLLRLDRGAQPLLQPGIPGWLQAVRPGGRGEIPVPRDADAGSGGVSGSLVQQGL